MFKNISNRIFTILFFIALSLLILNPKLYSVENIDNKDIIFFDDKRSLQMLKRSKFKNDFYQLINYFQPQINPLYCAIASSVIILNANQKDSNNIANQEELMVKKPKEIGGGYVDFKLYSQLTLLNNQTDKLIKDRKIIDLQHDDIIDPGLTLKNMNELLTFYNMKNKLYYVDQFNDKKISKFRKLLKSVLKDNDRNIIANFKLEMNNNRLKSYGHISPIIAYDQESDYILIMDVASHNNKWYWIDLAKFYKGMNTKDQDKYRGYIITKQN